MKEFDFELIFKLPTTTDDPSSYIDALFQSGCDDATLSTGKLGMISLSFSREAQNAAKAVQSAIRDVQQAIPNSSLVEATPDIVSITDISSILGHSRQYTRKLFDTNSASSIPSPIHVGSPSIWHLNEVLGWLKGMGKSGNNINETLFEISAITREVNLKRQLEASGLMKAAV
ncbi:MAG: DNA-binding protein [Campylobacterota bacterium]|nr:DNA-binding protein [Campylobacterota bacterium]